MSRTISMMLSALVVAVAVLAIVEPANACSVCFGDAESPQIKAMQAGIIVLLGCIGTVLAGFASLFGYWIFRSHRLALTNEGTLTDG